MENLDKEPSLNKIDDYNGTESKEKRRTVLLVVVFCLVIGAIFSYFKTTSSHKDYIGTTGKPGIVREK